MNIKKIRNLLLLLILLPIACETSTEDKPKEETQPTETLQPKNHIEYFNAHNFDLKYGTKKIVNSSQELQELFYEENNEDVKNFIKKYDDNFFNDNALVVILTYTPTPGYEVEVTSFLPENDKLKVTLELRDDIPPGNSSIMVIENWLILIETTKESIKDCIDIEVTEKEVSAT